MGIKSTLLANKCKVLFASEKALEETLDSVIKVDKKVIFKYF